MKNQMKLVTVLGCLVGSAFLMAEDFKPQTMPVRDPMQSGRGASTTTTVIKVSSDPATSARQTDVQNRVRHNSDITSVNRNTSKSSVKHTANNTTYVNSDSESNVTKAAGYKADNSGKNVRDRNKDTSVTPIDQAQSFSSDVEITRQIRKDIVADGSLSTYAKNVKIITLNGVVTLRGPVRSTAEKAKVEAHTEKFVTSNLIVNRLEVAPVGSAR